MNGPNSPNLQTTADGTVEARIVLIGNQPLGWLATLAIGVAGSVVCGFVGSFVLECGWVSTTRIFFSVHSVPCFCFIWYQVCREQLSIELGCGFKGRRFALTSGSLGYCKDAERSPWR